jgi:hypothetical protein
MRDIETIDAELRLLSLGAWRVARVLCDTLPSTELIDQLLDERWAAQSLSVASVALSIANSLRSCAAYLRR